VVVAAAFPVNPFLANPPDKAKRGDCDRPACICYRLGTSPSLGIPRVGNRRGRPVELGEVHRERFVVRLRLVAQERQRKRLTRASSEGILGG
jgi:hypothetical protein